MTVDVQALLELLATLVVVLGGVTAGIVWLRRWLRRQVSEPLGLVQAEVTTNHGASMKDAVDRTERAVQALTRRFEDHLAVGHAGGAVAPVVVVERPARDA